jgi:hypothetical protein
MVPHDAVPEYGIDPGEIERWPPGHDPSTV